MKGKNNTIAFIEGFLSSIFDLAMKTISLVSRLSFNLVKDILKAFKRDPAFDKLAHFIIIVLAALAFGWMMGIMVQYEVADPFDRGMESITIGEQMSAEQVSFLLWQKRIITSRFGFRLLAKLEGVENALQVGGYRLSPSMSLQEILDILSKGQISKMPVNIFIK
ncbi:MAG: endolytic transglycosylase MltG, partial [bacterium]